MTKLLPGLALLLATSGCGGDDDDSGGAGIDATPSGFDASAGADAAPGADGGADASLGELAGQLVQPSCAPNDAPAIRVLLGVPASGDECAVDEDAESVRFEVWTRDIEAPAIFAFAPGEAIATGQICPGGGDPCRSYETGQIQFDAFEDGVAASGSWTLIQGEMQLTGEFTATWCEPVLPEPCG